MCDLLGVDKSWLSGRSSSNKSVRGRSDEEEDDAVGGIAADADAGVVVACFACLLFDRVVPCCC